MPSKILPISKIKSDPTLSVSSFPVKAPSDEAYLDTPLPMLQTHDDSVNPSSAPELKHGVIKKLSHLDRDECLHRIEPDSQFQANNRSPLIRFQSRVRISSGVPRTGGDTKADNLSVISHSSSLASSPAPSIYAPLRSESDDEHSRWGSLGRRVNGSGVGKKKDRKLRETTERGRQMQICQYRRYGDDKQGQHERTPLIGHTVPSTHELRNMVGGVHDVDVRTRQSGDEIDLIFGTWPRRLINRYWWWWRLEPVICCDCLDDSDTEY